jgi:hypothetical protein
MENKKTVTLRNGMEVPDTQEARFVLAWEKRTSGKVWDSTVGKYGAWVEKK